jgi:Rps23 Pro-64 3,4-dihydroxylase Tpa1-like proline 4-hydroxylase
MEQIISKNKLLKIAQNNKIKYQSNTPFPNIYFENFFKSGYIKNVLNEFPNLSTVKNSKKFNDSNQNKNASIGESLLGKYSKELVHYLNSEPFLIFLSDLTGIQNLLPDPSLAGGGFHEIKAGGFLKIHADFNLHPKFKLDRRLNLLLYLNENWEDEWGGSFELWDEKMNYCVKKIPPLFNSVAIFSTTSTSYHGHPEPLKCPKDRSRKSIALYYYTNGRPKEEIIKDLEKHTTIFRARENDDKKITEKYFSKKIRKQKKRRTKERLVYFIKLIIPPVIVKVLNKLFYK